MGLFSSTSKTAGKNKKNTKKKSPLEVPKTAQDSIPYMGVYENGIIQVDENSYSKAYVIPDMNFLIEDTEKQKETFGNFMELLGSFGPEVHIQQVIFNKTIKHAELERKVLIPMKNDRLNEYREEMNEMLIDKMSKARNNIIHEKYFIATVEADDITSAKNTFSRLDDEIERGFQRVAGEKANAAPLTLVERLSTRVLGKNCLERFDLKEEDVYNAAINNIVDSIVVGEAKDIIPNTFVNFVILSTEKYKYGAAAFLGADVLKNVADKMGESALMVMPVSEEFVAVFPASDTTSINGTVLKNVIKALKNLAPDEVLSNNVYLYDREHNLLAMESYQL